MSYEDELRRLQTIITADGSTTEQRNAAREARNKLIDNSIEEAFKRFQDRTAEFNALMGRLRGVIDKIAANQLSGIVDTLNGVVGDIQKAAGGKQTGQG